MFRNHKLLLVAACAVAFGAVLGCHRELGGTMADEVGSKKSAPATKGEQFPPGPSRPAPTVQLEPADLATSVGNSPLHVMVSNLGAPVGAELLNQIARSVTLELWPERGVVATTISGVVDASGKSDQDEFAHIYLSPTAPLADRWYALNIDALPSGAAFAASANVLGTKDGRHVTRFRTGSEPVVAGVRAYVKDQGKQVIYVDFSERVSGDLGLIGAVSSGANASTCTPSAASVPAPSTGSATGIVPPSGSAAAGTASVQLLCTGAVDLRAPIQVSVQPGIRSTSGPAVNGGRAVTIAIDPAGWTSTPDGGKAFKPSSP